MAKIFARIQKPSLRWGLIFGIILGVVEVVYSFAISYITDVNAQSLLEYIPAIFLLVLGFYAGLRVALETGKWTSGLVAGIWVGVIGSVIANLIPLVNTLINLQSIVTGMQLYLKTHPVSGMKPTDYTVSDVIITALLEVLVSVIWAVFFTLLGGALGAFLGRRRALAVLAPTTPASEEILFEPPAANEDVEAVEVKDEAAK